MGQVLGSATTADGERELVMARWGMPGPPQFGGQPVTNIRNVSSPHWRGWLSASSRCLVPTTSFCEYEGTKPRKTPTWFALSEDRPLFAFAGLWTPLAGRARSEERAGRGVGSRMSDRMSEPSRGMAHTNLQRDHPRQVRCPSGSPVSAAFGPNDDLIERHTTIKRPTVSEKPYSHGDEPETTVT